MNDLLSSLSTFLGSLPSGIMALLILFVGWLAAVLLRLLLGRLLDLVRFSKLCDRLGITEFLRKGRVTSPPSRLVAIIAYWATLLVTLLQIARVLDIKMVTSFSARLGDIVPGLLAAAFIAVIGFVVVSFFGNFVMTVARNAGFPHAALLGRVVKIAGYLLVAGLALAQIDLSKTMFSTMVQILFAAIAFGLALAFGLGCKDLARDATVRWLQNLREKRRTDGRSDLEG